MTDRPGLASLVSPRQLAFAAVTFDLGANLLTQLVPGSREVEEILRTARREDRWIQAELPEAERARVTLESVLGRRIARIDDTDTYVRRPPHAPWRPRGPRRTSRR